MALNIHLVRLFVAVATHQSFSRAALALHISQPAVSKGVLALERQLGLTLLDRSQPDLPLTMAGRVLYDHAQALFASERQAESALAQVRGLERGQLTIGASTTIGTYLLPPIIADFHRSFPAIQLTLVIGNTIDLVPQLMATPLDIALVEGPADDEGIQAAPWLQDRLIVVAPPDHPARNQHVVSLSSLSEELFLLRETGSRTRAFIDARLASSGVTLPHIVEVGHLEVIKQLVIAGMGIGVIPDTICRAEIESERLIPLAVPELIIPRQLWHLIVTGRPLSPATQAFITHMESS
ncbi:MAG TPA: LysR family transcriptional regulator, partial [Ktedonobacterales bacterium]|nr:LysR family transcriptional regulator [Ktedonobacterales bacterium]